MIVVQVETGNCFGIKYWCHVAAQGKGLRMIATKLQKKNNNKKTKISSGTPYSYKSGYINVFLRLACLQKWNRWQFWYEIRKYKPTKDDCSDDIDMDELVSHFANKFKPTIRNAGNQSTIQEAERERGGVTFTTSIYRGKSIRKS